MAPSSAVPAAPAAVPAAPAEPERRVISYGGGHESALSEMEWKSMETPLEAATKNTHLSLQKWLFDRARILGLRKAGDTINGGEDDSDSEEDESSPSSKKNPKPAEKVEKDKEAVEEKNWSMVNLVFQESKMSFRGNLSELNFSNWVWKEVVRPKLEDSKGAVDDLAEGDKDVAEKFRSGWEEVHEILSEYFPSDVVKARIKAEEKKLEKEDGGDKKKDKKKDKKEDKKEDKKTAKASATSKDKKKSKPTVSLNTKEKLQAANLIKTMIYGENSKNSVGWANLVSEKDLPTNTPWEFQLAQVMHRGLVAEYRNRKKKEPMEKLAYYDLCQSLADALNQVKKQYAFFYKRDEMEAVLPLRDALRLQNRLQEGSAGVKFDLEWY